MNNKHLVAVYGSLRETMHNHTLLRDYTPISTETVLGFSMYSLGSFPAIIEDSEATTPITIELYLVDDVTFENLDYLEGYPTFYDRKQIDTSKGQAWIYFQHEKPNAYLVESGDWVEHVRTHHDY